MARKFKNKSIPRGILIDRGYVHIRIFTNGRKFQKCIGKATQEGVLDEAIDKLNEYRKQIRLGKFGFEEKSRRITIEQSCDTYWELHGSRLKSHKSVAGYLKRIKKHFAGRYADTLTYIDIENYRRARNRKVKPSTINKEHACITTIFYLLKKWQRERIIRPVRLPDENPGPLVKKVDEKQFMRKRILSPIEFYRFMRAASLEVRRIALCAIHTTLRLKDLKNLSLRNVNESTNQLEGIQAKTGKPYVVPINGVVRQLIDSAKGRHIFDFTNFRKQFEEAVAEAKIEDFQFRDLRRTGARTMLMKGLDLATVSAYLGHTTLQMTQAYVSATHDQKRIGAEILGSTYRWEGDKDKTDAPPLTLGSASALSQAEREKRGEGSGNTLEKGGFEGQRLGAGSGSGAEFRTVVKTVVKPFRVVRQKSTKSVDL